MSEAEKVKLKVEGDILSVEQTALAPSANDANNNVTATTSTPMTTTDDEITVNYRPYAAWEKWFAHRFSAFSTKKAWFALTLFVIFFAFNGPGYVLNQLVIWFTGSEPMQGGPGPMSFGDSQNVTLPLFFLIVSSLVFFFFIFFYRHPKAIRFNKDGVLLIYHGKRVKGNLTPWSRITQIELIWPSGKTSPQDSLLVFSAPDRKRVPLRMGAIASIEERHKVLQAIERFAGDIPRDPGLLEILTPAADHGYTELWLQALSAPPKRERLTPLLQGAELHDGRYKIMGQLGVGGQGTAYLASDKDDEVVLKEFILPVYVDINVRRQALEKMQNEAAMLRRLNNDRIVKLKDFFVEDHRGYLVLERIKGQSLRQTIAGTGAMSEARVRQLALQMCEILSYLQSLSPPVVHRDFTPDNLILGQDGTLKLVDFNVAQQTESTATGTVVGKHAYLPPEQFRGKPTTQSDIYAMGATLHFLLTADDPEPITSSHPRKLNSKVSEGLDAIVAKATQLDASKRYATSEQIKEDLSKLEL